MAVSPHFDVTALEQRNMALLSLLRIFENICVFIVLVFSLGIITTLLFVDINDLDNVSPYGRLAWYPIYLIVLGLSLRIFPLILRMVSFNPLIVLCVLWCFASVFWSLDSGISFRRSVALLMTTFMGLFFAARYDWSEFVQRLAYAFAFVVIITFMIVAIDPSRGIHDTIHPGAWRGAYTTKNYLGSTMTRSLAIMLCAFAMRPDRGWLWLPMAALSFLLVILSTSKTSLLSCIFVIGAFIFIRFYRRYPISRMVLIYSLLAIITLFTALMVTIPEVMLGLIGKDTSLTGRTGIWDNIFRSIYERPILGYGYSVYWVDEFGPSYYVRLALEWGVPSAHNGWLETWLSVGIIGVLMFALLYIWTLMLAIMRLKRGGTETYWVIIITLVFLIFSLSESSVLQQNDLSWIIFVTTSAKLFAFERPYWRNRIRENYFMQKIPKMIIR